MAQRAQCLLPSFGARSDLPKRPISAKTNTDAAQNARLLSALKHNLLDSLVKTAWGLLLFRYTGLEDVCFGYQRHGRVHSEQHSPNNQGTSACKLKLNESDTIGDLLKKFEEDNTFEDAVGTDEGPSARNEGHLPFNTIVIVRVQGDGENGGTSVRPVLSTTLPEQVDLLLQWLTLIPC